MSRTNLRLRPRNIALVLTLPFAACLAEKESAKQPEPAHQSVQSVETVNAGETTSAPQPVAATPPPAPPADLREADEPMPEAEEAPKSTADHSMRFGVVAGKKAEGAGRAGHAGPRRRSRGPVPSKPAPMQMNRPFESFSGDFEGRSDLTVNAPVDTQTEKTSTFAVDVDTAAYSIARRSLLANTMPTPTLVRVEELINYFKYDYDPPTSDAFSIQIDGAKSPLDTKKHVLRVGIQSKIVEDNQRLPSNLVFLVDTSCSMTSGDKLSLAKKSLEVAVDHLSDKDQVAITTYAGGVSVILPPTRGNQKAKIKRAIRQLQTAGGTAMEDGITTAYRQAAKMLGPNQNTRIIVCSDGDANIGSQSADGILKQIAGYVSEGVRLSTIGFGDGNYKDAMMETLADKGNGNYFYIDSERMAERVFGRDLTKMLQDVAQDVKIQVEFNSSAVKQWRLVGYENRHIDNKDFRNDKVDAGEIGAGHQVTALYELQLSEDASGNLATVRVRAKKPRGVHANEVERSVSVAQIQRNFERAPRDLKFAAAVMGGAELLRMSPHAQNFSYGDVIRVVRSTQNGDPDRAEFLMLMEKAQSLVGAVEGLVNQGPVTFQMVAELARELKAQNSNAAARILTRLAMAGGRNAPQNELNRLYAFGQSALGQ